MAKKEIMTDLWVYDMLKGIDVQNDFSAQGSNIREIAEYMLTLSINELSRSFLTIDDYISQDQPYIKAPPEQ